MKLGTSIVSRHPKVILIHEHDRDSGVGALISGHMQEFRSFRISDEAIEAIREFQPHILLIESDSVSDALHHYLTMVKECEVLQHKHQVVLLCTNKEAGLAYDICRQGIFYDYFVTRPMYEKFRLKSILNNLTRQFNQQELLREEAGEYTNAMDKDFIELVDEAKALKNNVQSAIDDAKSVIVKTKQDPESSAGQKELAETIDPLIKQIESAVQQNLTSMIKSVVEQQIKNNQLKELITGNASAIPEQLLHTAEDALSTVKRSKRSEVAKNQVASEPIENTPAIKAKKKQSVLLVEDNHIYRDMIRRILEEASFNVDESADGIEAIHKLKKAKYDLVLMDLFMPKLDGLNTTKQFRRISNQKELPIIALTSNKNKELVKKWVTYGISSYIMKPSKREQILEAVNSALAKKEQHAHVS